MRKEFVMPKDKKIVINYVRFAEKKNQQIPFVKRIKKV